MRAMTVQEVIDDWRSRGPNPCTIDCAWCGCGVEPVCRNVDGTGWTYPRDEQGDVACLECLVLPNYYIKPGHA